MAKRRGSNRVYGLGGNAGEGDSPSASGGATSSQGMANSPVFNQLLAVLKGAGEKFDAWKKAQIDIPNKPLGSISNPDFDPSKRSKLLPIPAAPAPAPLAMPETGIGHMKYLEAMQSQGRMPTLRPEQAKEWEAFRKPQIAHEDEEDKPKKRGNAFSEFLAAEQKELEIGKALDAMYKADITNEEKRIKGLEDEAKALALQARSSQEASQTIRTTGGIITSVLRGDVAGALQGVASLFQRAAGTQLAGATDWVKGTREAFDKAKVANKDTGQPLQIPTGGFRPEGVKPPAAGTPSASGGGEGGGGGAIAGIAAVAGPLAAVAGAASQVTSAMIGLAKAASPVATLRFNLALDDLQATMGKVFLPVLELATQGIRGIADVLATVLPSAEEMRDILSPVKDLFDAMRNIFDALAPAIKPLIPLVLQMVKIFTLLNPLIGPVILSIKLLGDALVALGLTGNLKSSVGTATQQASFSSVEQYAKKQYAAAFSAGTSTGEDPVKKLPSILETVISTIRDLIKSLDAVAEAKEFGKGVVEGAGKALTDPLGAAADLRDAIKRGILGW